MQSPYADMRERRAYEAINALTQVGHKFEGFFLDLGCGQGHLANVFHAKTGCEIICTDISIDLLRDAMQNAPCCQLVQCDGGLLPFKDSVFTTIVSNDVLEHTTYENGQRLVKESGRVIAENGKIYLSAMNRWEILEPHYLLPFFTWMPRPLWNVMFPIMVRFSPQIKTGEIPKVRYSEYYFPYTRAMMIALLKDFDIIDKTDMYAQEKIGDPKYIGSNFTRFVVRSLQALGLSSLALRIAKRLSVLVFICGKNLG